MNQAFAATVPKAARMCPLISIAVGFALFVLGGMCTVSTASFDGPNPLFVFMVTGGFLLFSCGGIGGTLYLGALARRGMSNVRAKISELNARFAERRVEFQLHETQHLILYRSTRRGSVMHGDGVVLGDGMHHGDVGVRARTQYTLVVQALGPQAIPAPHVLAAQALRPSAPPAMA